MRYLELSTLGRLGGRSIQLFGSARLTTSFLITLKRKPKGSEGLSPGRRVWGGGVVAGLGLVVGGGLIRPLPPSPPPGSVVVGVGVVVGAGGGGGVWSMGVVGP